MSASEVTGRFEQLDRLWYRIDNYDRMDPFLISLVSDSNHWAFISSKGSMTAGRESAENALFAYRTDDLLHRFHGLTGALTAIRMYTSDGSVLWEPFSPRTPASTVQRSLRKSIEGDSVEFIEHRTDLEATYSYRLATSDRYGLVKSSSLTRDSDTPIEVEILDGFVDVMAPDVVLGLVQTSSTLVDAYRRNEVVAGLPLALYSLEAAITDRAEPKESLVANVAWTVGFPDAEIVIRPDAVDRFVAGDTLEPIATLKGTRANFLVRSIATLDTEPLTWDVVADVARSHAQVSSLQAELDDLATFRAALHSDILRGSSALRDIIRSADGEQATADPMAVAHHFANTLFNTMRGGILLDNGAIDTAEFGRFVALWNTDAASRHGGWLTDLDPTLSHAEMAAATSARNDPTLDRLFLEYLPMTFGRRHGDPSRPWNAFRIKVIDDLGNPAIAYQGNWRDIFQNWEALGYSFPEYFESFVTKFLNASTVDGFNPYRISEHGIDWEIPETDNPWANIGYWGDHQIVYLLRLLEAWARFCPDRLGAQLNAAIYAYADVPYRIAPFDQLVADARSSIEFDLGAQRATEDRTASIGADGRLAVDRSGGLTSATLAEKLLVPAMSKMSNLVIGGGIWLNTQRPEWNDANNALAGYGLSVVTTGHLYRYLAFVTEQMRATDLETVDLADEVTTWLGELAAAMRAHEAVLVADAPGDSERFDLLAALGEAFSSFRGTVYESGLSSARAVPIAEVLEFLDLSSRFVRRTIELNQRDDGLYHGYNVLDLSTPGTAVVSHLPLMLEGQVAALSSGVLDAGASAAMMEALFSSDLYRPDQNSFLLYPYIELPSFLDRNVVDDDEMAGTDLLLALEEAGIPLIGSRDHNGKYRFAASVTSHEDLDAALDRVAVDGPWADRVEHERHGVHAIFEEVFDHQRFTGRSSSMYKYEGLGSIYWHQVAKLLVASQEAYWNAVDAGVPVELARRLADVYYRIRGGLSSDKTPAEYGAFPMDPYSHTPGHLGAQQPGMTGQVKEEVLTRLGEFGVRVGDGLVTFEPSLLRPHEFFAEATEWQRSSPSNGPDAVVLPSGSLAFSLGDVPIVYTLTDGASGIDVERADGSTTSVDGTTLDRDTSNSLFRRDGSIAVIRVSVPRAILYAPTPD